MVRIDEIVKYGSKAEILDLITILSSPIKINQYLILKVTYSKIYIKKKPLQ
jgi:hypothetical protein